MKPLLPAHRAAEEFASVIDGHPSDATADRYAPLAAVVTVLRTHEHPEPRPEFVSDLRSRLMLAAETELVPAPSVPRPTVRPPRRRERHLAAAAAALVLVGGTAGMAAASQGSVPGDPLYPLKLGIEHASVAMHPSDAGKGADLLGQAGTRLDEVRSLLSGDGSTAEVESTLQSFTSTANRGSELLFRSYQRNGDDQSIATVRAFAAEQMTTLADLAPEAPPQAAGAFQRAANTVAAIDQQARVLCVACGGAGALAVPDDLIGPTSAPSLDALIQHPAQLAEAQARAARALAAAAEAAGRVAARQPGTPTGQQSAASGSRASTTTPDQGGSPTSTVTSSQPAKDLVDGVTQKSGGLTTGLSDTLDGVTGATKGVTGQVTGGVDTTLGGDGNLTGDLGGTVTGTVDGVLGGLTGN